MGRTLEKKRTVIPELSMAARMAELVERYNCVNYFRWKGEIPVYEGRKIPFDVSRVSGILEI